MNVSFLQILYIGGKHGRDRSLDGGAVFIYTVDPPKKAIPFFFLRKLFYTYPS